MSSPAHDSAPVTPGFAALALAPAVKRVLADVGYETPSPIQAAAIPPLLEGRDVVGQAQTGTGKTAAFALPILSLLDPTPGKPQVLVLAPTRELAIQVAEAFKTYAAHIDNFRVLPIYGGTGYGPQLHGLRRGVHVVVGTPGRIIDHLRKGTLDLSALRFVVLDEADEMLRMGFVEAVETILSSAPDKHQTALFSATMPKPIRRIAQKYLDNPVEVSIAAKTTTASHIHQRYWRVSGLHKLDALTRILEAEPFDAMLVFARTRQSTETLAQKLQARGFTAAAIHGDVAQAQRERLIRQLRDGQLDILIATDVAARGLDVGRISHVLNYDIPYDTESYVHRIGRTGRAGHDGQAILFVTPREQGMLRSIERATRQPIESMQLPTVATVNDRRIERFTQSISEMLESGEDLTTFRQLIERYEQQHDTPAIDVAAALARMAHGGKPLLLNASDPKPAPQHDAGYDKHRTRERKSRNDRPAFERERPRRDGAAPHRERPQRDGAGSQRERAHRGEAGKDTYRLDVGQIHNIKPGNIIGAIANEAGIDSQYIGRLTIRDDYSLIDLPEGMPNELLQHLKKTRVAGRPLRLKIDDGTNAPAAPASSAPPRPKRGPKPPSHKDHEKRSGGFKPPRRRT